MVELDPGADAARPLGSTSAAIAAQVAASAQASSRGVASTGRSPEPSADAVSSSVPRAPRRTRQRGRTRRGVTLSRHTACLREGPTPRRPGRFPDPDRFATMGSGPGHRPGPPSCRALRRTPWERPAASAAPARRRPRTTVSAPTPDLGDLARTAHKRRTPHRHRSGSFRLRGRRPGKAGALGPGSGLRSVVDLRPGRPDPQQHLVAQRSGACSEHDRATSAFTVRSRSYFCRHGPHSSRWCWISRLVGVLELVVDEEEDPLQHLGAVLCRGAGRSSCRRLPSWLPAALTPRFARVVGEQLAQLATAPVQPGHHGADRGAHDLGDLLVGEALDVGEVDRQPEVLGELLQRVLDVAVGKAARAPRSRRTSGPRRCATRRGRAASPRRPRSSTAEAPAASCGSC